MLSSLVEVSNKLVMFASLQQPQQLSHYLLHLGELLYERGAVHDV